MSRPPGSNKITLWMNSLTEEDRADFVRYCRMHYNDKPAIYSYLRARDVDISMPTVYNWVGKNVLPGDIALQLNQEAEKYAGLDEISVLETALAQLSQITKRFIEIVEDEPDFPVEDAASLLPAYSREMRSIAMQLSTTKYKADTRAIGMMCAARLVEIILNTRGVKDTSDESLFQRVCESAILQLKEEIDAKSLPSG